MGPSPKKKLSCPRWGTRRTRSWRSLPPSPGPGSRVRRIRRPPSPRQRRRRAVHTSSLSAHRTRDASPPVHSPPRRRSALAADLLAGMANFTKNFQSSSKPDGEKKYQGTLVASPAKAISPKTIKHIVPKQLILSRESTGHVASFLVKVIALEVVRRISKAKCPFVWNSIQALQVLGYPPFRWIQRWAPLKFVVQGIQKLSTPLLFLSVTSALGDLSSKSDEADDGPSSTTGAPDLPAESNETSSISDTREAADGDGTKDIVVSENWLVLLFKELEKQGITLPERFSEDELRRFHMAANGDLSILVSSVKKTIRWRETFHILTLQELEKWSHLVFWHGFDTTLRPCLVIRLGVACSSIAPRDRPCFGQAVVSQIDHGIIHLTNEEDPRITVLLDCHGISPFKFPMQMMRSFVNLVQENYPNRLGVLIVVRLPPVVRVIAQTFIQLLKPSTKQKLRFEGESYKKTLAEFLQIVPAFLGGKCNCSRCKKPRDSSLIQAGEGSRSRSLTSAGSRSRVSDMDFDEELEELPSPYNCENAIRAAVVGLLMVWIFVAFLAGMNDPQSMS
ncbi:SEC14-like protein 1 [Triticum dicoccoides]|uniref:SEC14-like protein 1 n=1 Tax=Triticum dicoccoides TaxID=85692 RepID=UPI00188E9046|nr:SEC14-like protein 1 [Triticum dicoccoides]